MYLIIGILFQSSFKLIQAEPTKLLTVQNVAINVSILFIILLAINYVSTLRPFSIDLTTFGTYTLSAQGKNIVKNVEREVTITAFYPFFIISTGRLS